LSDAQLNLGLCYLRGLECPNSPEQAVQCSASPPRAGDASAQNNLGIGYENGSGVARDPVEAAKWYLLAAGRSHSQAITNRDRLLLKLTSAEASEAQKRAAAFVPHPSEQDHDN